MRKIDPDAGDKVMRFFEKEKKPGEGMGNASDSENLKQVLANNKFLQRR